MLVHPEAQLRRALEFLGWQTGDEDIRKALAQSSLEKMREKERSGYFLAHIRVGKMGDWHDRYSAEELEIFMNISVEALRRFGYA
jgi:hypothetical protein